MDTRRIFVLSALVNISLCITPLFIQFSDFIVEYNKTYKYGDKEYFKRLLIFKNNVEEQKKLNNATSSAEYGITKFSDLTESEFNGYYLKDMNITHTAAAFSHHHVAIPYHVTPMYLPKRVDWRTRGVITNVIDQHDCGSCWAVSVVDMMSSMYALKHNKRNTATKISMTSLSIQQLIDCSYGYKNALTGCEGGNLCTALEWLMKTKTNLQPVSSYQYATKRGLCRNMKYAKGVSLKSFRCYRCNGFEKTLLYNVWRFGPVAVSVDATQWRHYRGGVIQHHCGTDNNHAVLIVGYDIKGNIPYYIVKNSWGKDFGIKGYIHIKAYSNTCGIASTVTSVITN